MQEIDCTYTLYRIAIRVVILLFVQARSAFGIPMRSADAHPRLVMRHSDGRQDSLEAEPIFGAAHVTLRILDPVFLQVVTPIREILYILSVSCGYLMLALDACMGIHTRYGLEPATN